MMKYEYEYRLVKEDINTDEDVGIIKIRRQDKRLRPYHWIVFPNGDLRADYNSKALDDVDRDMFIAFKMVPELKVVYRPMSNWLVEAYEYVAVFTIFAVGLCGILGIASLVAGYFFSNADALINTTIGSWFTIVLLYSSVVGVISCFICTIGERRYHYISDGDREKQYQEKRKYEELLGF